MKYPHRLLCGFEVDKPCAYVGLGSDVRKDDPGAKDADDAHLPPYGSDRHESQEQSYALQPHLDLAGPNGGDARINPLAH